MAIDKDDPKGRLVFLDAIERLGVAYHFEEEIEAILHNLYTNHYDDHSYKDDLHYVSLHFRILRQHGFFVSFGTLVTLFISQLKLVLCAKL